MLDSKINYFIEVVNEGSFSAAARKLYISQSAVSQQVALLEQEIGITLLDRSGYRPVLTEEGKKYYRFCIEAENQYRQLLQSLKGNHKKVIRIAFTGNHENRGLVQLTSWFRKYHPDISFSYSEGTFGENTERLEKGQVDIAFGIDHTFNSQLLHTKVLYPYKMCVITSFDHPFVNRKDLSPRDLKDQKFIVLTRNFGTAFYQSFMEAFHQDGGSARQIVKETDTYDELIADVSIGMGIAIVSEEAADDTSVKKIPLVNTHHRADYVIAWKDSSDVIDELVEAAAVFYSKPL